MLETIGYEPGMARWARASDASVGRVLSMECGVASVLTRTGAQRAGIGAGLLGPMAVDATLAPCTGDWCVLRSWPDHRTTLERVLPRRTTLRPGAAGGHRRVLCSNVDVCAVVVAAQPPSTTGDIERLVAAARRSGARPLVVLTTPELDRPDRAVERLTTTLPNVEVTAVSVRSGAGVEALRLRLEGRLTMALLGAAGQGRSALAAALVGAEVLGPWTVGGSRLLALPGGGAVIDVGPPTSGDQCVRSIG